MKVIVVKKNIIHVLLLFFSIAVALALLIILVSPYLPLKSDFEPTREAVAFEDIPHLSASNKNKILLIGVDGASWNVLDPLIKEGRLPNMQKLIREGTKGKLKSLPIMKSPRIWTTIVTGYLPEKHGITDFVIEGIPAKSYHRKLPALWNMLGNTNSSAFIGFWATWPPEETNGIMVSDYLGFRASMDKTEEFRLKDRHLTYPMEFLDEITERGLLHDQDTLIEEFYRKFTKGPIREGEIDLFYKYEFFKKWLRIYAAIYWQDVVFRDIAKHVLANYKQDLTAVYFQGVDSVQHLFWCYHAPEEFEGISEKSIQRFGDIIDEYNCMMDSWIGSLCSLADEDTITIIVSDHGFKATPMEIYRKDPDNPPLTSSGRHDTYGIIVMAGPHIKRGYTIQKASVQDITPTILYLLGLPIAEDMEGRVLTQAITHSYKLQHPIYTIKRYPKLQKLEMEGKEHIPKLDERIKERLKALGYIK